MLVSWNTTKRCNLYCEHCYRDASDKAYKGELNTQEGKKLIEDIKKAGFRLLIFSGGEPLMRKDIYELISYADRLKLIPALGTNGTLITKEVASKLKESGIRAAAISIDSTDMNKHDKFRGKAGSFKRAMEGIKNCLEVGIRVQINTTISKDNKEEILKLTDFAEMVGASSHHVFFLVATGRGKDIKDRFLDKDEYFDLLDVILERQRQTNIELKPTCAPQFMSIAKEKDMDMRFTRGCIAGIKYCCVLPNGDVNICPYSPVNTGNIREKAFDDIWKNSPIFNRLRDFENYKGKCGVCSNISICGGCRARAYEETGDYMEADPLSTNCYIREGR
ncbi:radical SAM/SPASM domain-containing protein [Clostridiisalibacter paucivorans]|uniref:radical SAM/SPASM domain-containing protein n=1 Tax=Clostridiisalibacter paucivorans TaxID=408753 RepID=UPI00047E4B76|nr:radical SAM protein [Clostridiisalibacter paucivorans]